MKIRVAKLDWREVEVEESVLDEIDKTTTAYTTPVGDALFIVDHKKLHIDDEGDYLLWGV